ncbi:hypothetical protein HDU76_002595 [Blyttiomyces sp. JEL0837]|nr:hypothetical protein HDU76_002595 [Blyttiomyces sp. JEL0837]
MDGQKVEAPQYVAAGAPVYAQQVPQQQVITMAVNSAELCPAGGIHQLTDEFTCCGITLAILFFPIGVLCCFLMTEKKCAKCGFKP